MPARIHIPQALSAGLSLSLPEGAARHVQVLRLQPGAALTLFDGSGGQWLAEVLAMGRKSVSARVLAHQAIDCELARAVTLAVGMPANERMDTLVEKATELGVARIVPLVCERSVLRVAGERAERKAAHWQAIAVAACEQSGRNRVPEVAAPLALKDWLAQDAAQAGAGRRGVLSFALDARPLRALLAAADQGTQALTLLSGPEGGLSDAELALAEQQGFLPITLGARILRADTAPLAALAGLCALDQGPS
jgi:16S rRNA (uracil1498-N3)-methyltransferase